MPANIGRLRRAQQRILEQRLPQALALVRHLGRGAQVHCAAGRAGQRSAEPLGKPTLRTSRHIIKGSDDATPYMGFNELYGMRVLEKLGTVPVARTRMSDDGRVLVVERFDVNEHGEPTHGLEDACSLLGLPPHEKYATATEKVLHATRAYLPAASVRAQLEHLAWLLLANYVLRNANCHAKNIALSYTSHADVAFAPGRSLEHFFNARLGIAPRRTAEIVERLCESAV